MPNQPYKLTTKELEKSFDLNVYDFGARVYPMGYNIWWQPDPHAEKYPSISPYAYCLNNPVRYNDPDGRDAKLTGVGTKENPYIVTAAYYYQEGSLSKTEVGGLNSAIKSYNELGGKDGVKVKGADGNISYVKYNLSAEGVKDVNSAVAGTEFETSSGDFRRYGNTLGTEEMENGNEFGSANFKRVDINRSKIAEGVADGASESRLIEGTFTHEIGHNFGGEHEDGNSTMSQVLSTTRTSDISSNGNNSTKTYNYPSTSKDFTKTVIERMDQERSTPASGRIWTPKTQ